MDLKTKVEKYKKEAFKPIISDETSNESLLDSKFGGKPFVSKEHTWPVCECGELMAFFLQLNSNHLPSKLNKAEVFGEGLLQLFYCIKCDNYEPFTNSHKIRLIKFENMNTDIDASEIKSNFEYHKINDWQEFFDYPRYDEILDLEKLNDDEADQYENEYKSKAGEKLLGWPHWVQGVEYVNCPICAKQMRYIFQIDSERNIDYMFGDMGVGHLSQCKDHPDQLVFTWACC